MTIVADFTNTNYNYIIIRGGESCRVIASRLAEALPDYEIPMIEAGPSDLDNKPILDLRNMGNEFDYGFKSTEQPNVNSNILHLRAKSTDKALKIPNVDSVNHEISLAVGISKSGVSFFSFTSDQDTGYRASASVAYTHPILRGEEKRPNLMVLTNAWTYRINVIDGVTTGVTVTLQLSRKLRINAKKEIILCAGANDTPRLVFLSGIGL
ncbi:hypothetical protein FOVSG1_010168 [Fusarium oxysporum f. sp. vasinfectum]